MADTAVPHLQNDLGVDNVRIGVKEFQCMGASPPHDHPHVYIDMGDETQTICPYCSTVYLHDSSLGPHESDPPGCVASIEDPSGHRRPIGHEGKAVA